MRLASFLLCLTLLLGVASNALSRPSDREPAGEATPRLLPFDDLLAPPPPSTKVAVTESLTVYGGPGTLDGKFQDGVGQPDWQGWTTVDRTDIESLWQVSTYLADNLGAQGAGNHALWCGRAETQVSGWATAPGYGNNWLQDLIWSSGPLADPDSAQVVQLDFLFNHDLEPAYDFFSVAYDSAGTWVEVYRVDGRSPGSPGAFDVRGRKVRALDAETLPAGPQRLGWDARDDRGQSVASGVYLVRLRTNGEERWNKVAIVK